MPAEAWSTQQAVLIGVAAYMLVMLGVGAVTARRADSLSEFLVAGRRLPLGLCSVTVMATWFGGGTVMGAAGAAYDDGLLGVVEDPFGASLALFLVGMFFARLFRRMRIMTTADFMEQRYGRVAAMAITVSALFANTAWVGALLVAFGLVFQSLAGVPLLLGIASGAVVIFVYTALGGMWAVAVTDFLQMIVVAVGVVVLLVVVLADAGGWSAVAARLPEHSLRLLPLENTPAQWLTYLRAWAILGVVDIAAQTLMQRVSAAKSERVAQYSFYLASAGYLLLGMAPVALGLIGRVTTPDLPSSEGLIPALAVAHLHPLGVAVFVGALVAAIMSSADSALLANASLLARNVLPLVRPDATPRQALLVARVSIPVFGAIAVVVAMEFQVVFDLMVDGNVLGLAAIIVPFVLGAWWKQANRTGALSAMGAGISAWLLTLFFAPGLPADFVGLGASLVTMLVVTPLTQSFDPPRPLLDDEGREVAFGDRLGVLPPFARS